MRSALFLLIKGKFMEIFSKITQSFKNQSFMKTIGAQLDLVDDGKAIISVKLKK